MFWLRNADMNCTFRTSNSDAMNITVIVDESSTKGFKVSRFPPCLTTPRSNLLPKLRFRSALVIWTIAPVQAAAKKDSPCPVSLSLCVYLRDCLHVSMLMSPCAVRAFARKPNTTTVQLCGLSRTPGLKHHDHAPLRQ